METETRQVLENLRRILAAAGYDSSHVVSATVYLKDMDDYQKMNVIYGGYFQDGAYPARVAVQVAELPRQAHVEISAIAYRP
jgi:2-iminobutanoate/2-iminopropanoate deaminase